MKSSISMKSWKTTISLSVLLFLMFAPTVLIWPFIGVSMPSSLSSPPSLANGSITYGEGANVITVTGYSSRTPCTFNDVWNADKAGERVLMANASAVQDMNLTTQVLPTDKVALKLRLVVSGFVSNGFVNVTGTDKDGNAQTETNIAITGSGNYSTNSWFATVSTKGLDCNGSFGIAIYQLQWGVVWKQTAYQFQIDALFYIGDGSIATYFSDVEKEVLFMVGGVAGTSFLWIRTGATCTLGQLDNLGSKISSRGCHIMFTPNVSGNLLHGDGVGYFYSCQFTFLNGLNRIGYFGATSRIWNCNANERVTIYRVAGDIYNLVATSMGSGDFALREITGTVNRVFLSHYYRLIDYGPVGGVYNLKGVIGTLASSKTVGVMYGCTATINLINCDFDLWSFYWDSSPSAKV